MTLRRTVATLAAAAVLATTGALVAPAAQAADNLGKWYYLSNGTKGGPADVTFAYGRSDDVTLIGDWDGDGKDTLAVRRGATYYLTNQATGGAASTVFTYGKPGDTVLVGDWNGDRKDTLAVRRAATYYLTNGTRGGKADTVFTYGKPGDTVLVGDWNGDRKDTLAVRRAATYYLTNGTRGGKADTVFTYGKPGDTVLVGDWNGDRKDTLGVRRVQGPTPSSGGAATIKGDGTYRVGTEVAPGRYKARVPADSWLCYWASARDARGEDIVANDVALPGETLYWDITASVPWVETDGCGTWTKVSADDAPRLVSPIRDGFYRVGIDIAPGTYQATVPADDLCYVESLSAFDGDLDSVIANDLADAGTRITWAIEPGDEGFRAAGCGTWTRTDTLRMSAAGDADDVVTRQDGHVVERPELVPALD
ncbi:hypothetical protein [Puerhibacterium puerhi]|uniref:hypothetical protein n=1 Tax=Puerhibacterium puerhi TaxID=2692623 RepID=UPI001358CC00|nr:hypothetical protein [Puerhibacterium puerhi]